MGKPSYLEGPAQHTSHGDDSVTLKLRGMNTLVNKEEQDIKMNHISHTASKKNKRPSSRSRKKKANEKLFEDLKEAGTIPHTFNIGCFVRDKDRSIYGIAGIHKVYSLIDPLNAVEYVCTMYDVHRKYKRLPLEDVPPHIDAQLKNL